MDLETLEVLNKPYQISAEIGVFYTKSVGGTLDLNKELSLLIDWEESIAAAEKVARKFRQRLHLRDMTQFKEECAVFMECNAQ